ncbi:CDP-diacylglycerol--serine O-phosphatidyltransferase [Histophilus somni]|uniref:CDP-diacylglycerol--serine O-phosphatidyltransferase n=1 Tax=Histophilus somni TaxID=731 RepID=A0AAX2S262_HISSO|nr:CDP-diacylglycerol--serine O-phosphatidyltransferase [Histophilus somni]QEH09452.1 CDP-diacylglycerol--serine O-phosphatidyltransferase [Histophilus somni]QEH11897.1 CDP-diacylglycerol--serine O-phosphatidyltransferase [Histophilus somni]QEH25724.1 CDP-diacylglycerol--serine O-phosphatidyltransferase [Histophilus somni]QEH26379.1 CDP-diacylglycerol--serine O-phosphatidyltransferase [Histophilus somni]QEH50565.1 CDP-diacylglycerol--serine O-phosphatidyltransferase [Histophilus somni]
MLINKTKRAKQNLERLPCIPLQAEQVEFIYHSSDFKQQIIQCIRQAKSRIYFTALYWQNDEAGQQILDEIYRAKQANPELEVKILVDWHRAQRNLLGAEKSATNADWYCDERSKYQLADDPNIFFGVPINTREVFGVLHIKGFVFDDTVLYSGASINNVYLHQQTKYRYDRYHKIEHKRLADILVSFVKNYLFDPNVVYPLDSGDRPKTKEIRQYIRNFRKYLASEGQYYVESSVTLNDSLTICPLFGLGANHNLLNQTIEDLFQVVEDKLTICTPYFNFPRLLQQKVRRLLAKGKQIEIIVGDKTASDFYIPPSEPFKMAGALPYLYEKNLRHFSKKFTKQIEQGQLVVRIWKDGENSYHLKGIWVDDCYMLLTGNNLNPRAWRLDAENGLFIHDPKQQLQAQIQQELTYIRRNTTVLKHYTELSDLTQYPKPVQKILKKFARIKADKLVKMIL